MKRIMASVLMAMMSLGLGGIARADDSAEKAVAAAEEQWTQAERTNNADAAVPFLADKFIFVDTDGSISSRAKFVADSKAIKYTSVDVSDFHVTVTGQTAVATMIFKSKGTLANGNPMDINARWVDTWVKMPDGKWQCILSQGSDIKK